MIWLLLGVLLFGGGALLDLTRPLARVQTILEEVGGVVADPVRREAARGTAERMAAEAETTREAIDGFARSIRELDAAETSDEVGYLAAVDAVSDAIDASERRLLEERMQLRAVVTAAEWSDLMELVRPADG
jgi:hypothetical protein